MFILLLLAWFIFNGTFTVELLIFGIVLCALIYLFMWKFLGYSVQRELLFIKRIPGFLKYLGLLIWEIIKANFATANVILSFGKEPDPVLVTFTPELETSTGRVMLANSITLTPGTVTVAVEDGEFLVHALTEEFTDGIEESSFVTNIQKLEQQ